MDYGTLAQLSNPGQAVPGDRWGRIRRFQNLNNIQQQALQSSIPLAESGAQRELQANQEWQDAAPGRRDLTTLGNMNAEAGVKNFDRDQALKELDAQLQDADKRAKLADVTQDIAGDADAYLSGDTRIKSQIIQKNKGRKLRNKYVIGTDPNTDDMLFEIAGRARANAPKLANDLEKERIKGSNRLEAIKAKGITDTEIAAKKAEWAKELQSARLAIKDNKPLSLSQQEALDLVLGYPDVQDRLDYYFSKPQATSAAQGLNQKAGAVNSVMSGQGVRVPEAAPIQRPTPNPNVQAPVAPTQPQTKPQFEKNKIYKDKNGNRAKWNGTSWEPVQ